MEIKHTTTTPSHFEGGCQCIEIIVSYSITFWYNLIALGKNIYLQHKIMFNSLYYKNYQTHTICHNSLIIVKYMNYFKIYSLYNLVYYNNRMLCSGYLKCF